MTWMHTPNSNLSTFCEGTRIQFLGTTPNVELRPPKFPNMRYPRSLGTFNVDKYSVITSHTLAAPRAARDRLVHYNKVERFKLVRYTNRPASRTQTGAPTQHNIHLLIPSRCPTGAPTQNNKLWAHRLTPSHRPLLCLKSVLQFVCSTRLNTIPDSTQ
jgi:hypothetical protein